MDACTSVGEASRINPLTDSKAWDEIVHRFEETTIFHTSAWFRVLHDTYGFEPCCFVREDTHPTVLSLMEVDSWLTGRRGVALPFTDFCPTLLGKNVEFSALWRQLLNLGARRNWCYIELRDFPKEVQSTGLSPSITFYHHVLTLGSDPAKVQSNFESSTRRAIRKADGSANDTGR